jgi:hypothetical protein
MDNIDLKLIECNDKNTRIAIDIPSRLGVSEVSLTFKLGNRIVNDIDLRTVVRGIIMFDADIPF